LDKEISMISLRRRLLRMESTTTAYFLRFNAPLTSFGIGIPLTCFIAGTVNFPRTWLLLLVTCFITFQYWKSEIHGNLEEFYRYNAREMHMEPLISFLALIAEMPEWATNNYLLNFLLSILASYPRILEYK